MNVTYNQNYLFPAFYTAPGYVGIQYPFNVYSMNSVYATAYPDMPTSGLRDSVPTAGPYFSTATSPVSNGGYANQTSQAKADVKPLSGQASVERSSCAFEDASNRATLQMCDSNKSSDGVQTDEQQQCLNTSPRQCLNTSPPTSHHQLRLPTISVTANMAANVMSEECDLGYCSFTDLSPLPEVAEGSESTPLSEILDAQSAFSNIIDDVLDSMDGPIFGNNVMSHDLAEVKWDPSTVDYSSDESTIDLYDYSRTQCSPDNHETALDNTHMDLPERTVSEQRDLCYTQFETKANPQTLCYEQFETKASPQTLCYEQFETKASPKTQARLNKRRERPHSCHFCNKSFTQKSTLRTHIRTHTGEKPYACTFCARAFSDYSTYRKHVRIHTGERPYTCSVCNRSFTQSGNMLRHREMHNRSGK